MVSHPMHNPWLSQGVTNLSKHHDQLAERQVLDNVIVHEVDTIIP